MTKIKKIYYVRFIFRAIFFIISACFYIKGDMSWIIYPMFIIFMFEMITRFIPSDFEGTGCQKQFVKNYLPVENVKKEDALLQDKSKTLISAISWILLNAIVGILYFSQVLDKGLLILICLAYSVCDMICVLFFCPFQLWIMKNRCCTTCRIYNWDYAMMFTPMIFIINEWYAWSLLLVGVLLLIQWEVKVYKHPEYFSEKTNKNLWCVNCRDKNCRKRK